jgi:hypothetical protein
LDVTVILIIVIVIVVLAGIYIWRRYFSGKRAEAFRKLAQTMNFTFSPKGDRTLLGPMGEFSLFSKGQYRRISNVLTGKFNDIQVTIFDYQYTTGSGDSSHIWKQTVLAMESGKLEMPNFILRPEGLFDKIGDVFGRKDIDFEIYPKFSKQYFLRGNDEESVRNIFTDSAIQYYEQHPGLCTEGEGDRFIFYHGSRVVPVDQIQNFMQQGYELFELFKH